MSEFETALANWNGASEVIPERKHAHEARVFQVTASSLGVNVGPEERLYWEVGAKAAAILDTLVDSHSANVADMFTQVISSEPQGIDCILTETEAKVLAEYFSGLSPDRQSAWRNSVINLPVFAGLKAQAPNIRELISVSLSEAEMVFAPAFMLDTEGYQDKTARERFNDWLISFGRVGYAYDYALDMPDDYASGIIAVAPTPWNRLRMLYSAKNDVVRCFGIGGLSLLEIAKTSWVSAKERKKNTLEPTSQIASQLGLRATNALLVSE